MHAFSPGFPQGYPQLWIVSEGSPVVKWRGSSARIEFVFDTTRRPWLCGSNIRRSAARVARVSELAGPLADAHAGV